ncbi:histidine protein methyltransferase 1 homolog [Ornithodoros turicata]|uniref:histidine protein methyltransferase 1 homolog n=1 Tax=Ornithodoros turicata TaxID=34597 RepID=UPI0031391F56
MSFSFNFEVPGAENDTVQTPTDVETQRKELVTCIAKFEEVKPSPEHEHVHDELENSVLDLVSLKVQFLVGGQVEQRLQGRLGDAVRENLDIIPSVYEGGMKVWEGSVDLAEYVEGNVTVCSDTTVLELGCGAGLPGLVAALRGARVDFQDYNREVLELVTVPNAFANLGKDTYRQCRFFAGDWSDLLCHLKGKRYDLILTSETIYNPANYGQLLAIFAGCLKSTGSVLLAAKTCYFGVGGGTREFEDHVVKEGTFQSKVVFVTDVGVQREILELRHKT